MNKTNDDTHAHLGRGHLVKNDIDISSYLWDIQGLSTEIICGRLGFMFLQTFNFETEYLLKNALVLFEQGYLDVAYFQLRSAVELSMVSVYLLFEHEKQKEIIRKWQKLDDFPTFNKMINELKLKSQDFKKLHEETPILFESIKEVNKTLNKKTHKQSTHDFYRTRDSKNRMQQLADATPLFLDIFKKVFAISLTIKLMIDPMPLLLTDDEIYTRIVSPMAGPLRDYYIKKYDLEEMLSEFRQTTHYKGFHDEFIKFKKHSHAFIEFENFGNINYEDIELLMSEFDDLSSARKLVITICDRIRNVLSICFGNGSNNFVTNINGFSEKVYFNNYEWFVKDGLLEQYVNVAKEKYYESRFMNNERAFYINTSLEIKDHDISFISDLINKYKDENI